MYSLSNHTFSWRTTLLYIALTTLVLFLIGWLQSFNLIPINKTFNYSESEYKLLQLWFALATFFGVILPGVTLLVFLKISEIRMILSFYFFVVFIQLMTERILSRLLFQTIVVMVGSLYSAFRVWQLWSGQQILAASTELSTVKRRFIIGVFWLMLLFWLSNIIVNFVIFGRKLL